MTDIPVDKKFAILCQITRAQHFAWREAVGELSEHVDPAAVAIRMWEITGAQTAAAYVKRLDPDAPLAPQFAKSSAWSISAASSRLRRSASGRASSGRSVKYSWMARRSGPSSVSASDGSAAPVIGLVCIPRWNQLCIAERS